MYGPAMTYPLVAMAVDEEALDCIQTPVLPIIVQKLGINCNLPVAIRHGPIELGGLALTDLRTELGIESLKYLRNSIYCQTAAGDTILATLKHLQQESGIGEALLEVPTRYVPYLTPTWVASIRQYMSNHNLSVTLTDVLSLSVQRSGDSFIMVSDHLHRYSVIHQKDINLVRMYLQVTILSDMAAPDGRTLLPLYLQGNCPIPFHSTALWPRQENPTTSQKSCGASIWRLPSFGILHICSLVLAHWSHPCSIQMFTFPLILPSRRTTLLPLISLHCLEPIADFFANIHNNARISNFGVLFDLAGD